MNPQELINTYTSLSDEQLLEAYHNLGDYTVEAKEALTLVIKNRGGIENLLANERLQNELILEAERIRHQVRKLIIPGVDKEFLNKMINSEILEESQKEFIIRQAVEESTKELEDKKIKPRTLLGGGLAAGIASLIGGVLWGLQMMWSGRVFAIFFFGLVLLSYGLIKLFTKQSHKNVAVILLTAISVIIALVISQLMFEVFGRQ
ncbi:MAG: hypothetical protein ACSLE0_01910 [Chitinophagaceae bacterium]